MIGAPSGAPNSKAKGAQPMLNSASTNTFTIMSIVRKPEKVSRYVDFSGMNRSDTMAKDSVYATDIDCAMEFSNKFLILIEIKEKGQILRTGQRLFLERLADSWVEAKDNRKAIVMFATHSPELVNEIPVSECTTTKAYVPTKGWVDKDCNLIDCLHALGDSWGIKKLQRKDG